MKLLPLAICKSYFSWPLQLFTARNNTQACVGNPFMFVESACL